MNDDEIFALIKRELRHQDEKWGANRILDSRLWLTIIGEEFGEACHANLERNPDNYLDELVDIAASAVSAIHSFVLENKTPTKVDEKDGQS